MTRLLLASASPARRATLRAAGIEPLVAVSSVDEEAVLAAARERYADEHGALDPADAVLVLAQAKAHDVAAHLPEELAEACDLVVLGCDSMLELDGQVLGKPSDAQDAVARWHAMRGRAGVLHTGHWLVDLREPDEADDAAPSPAAGSSGTGLGAGRGAVLGATSSTTVHFADVTDDEIAAYVATGEPLAVAGAFTVDGRGGPFVERIEGDHHGVVGLSLPLLRSLLAEVDVPLHTLWSD
ncbi:septum formation inhibitor Maf [Cellulomonas sp. DKR-3]|uniref:Nucleoside triphosphate pyrophosphatase n=1 Tax=Cellulomonas fulva TaxID=2835530 RepID=A0ABS5TUD6_9CELL|nr:nucleoside triphosphate pyrophosphatase [Cellulomonas fulva]MBT0992747.1 septum formation inhibitor Maf [Cellulomonas fulva]